MYQQVLSRYTRIIWGYRCSSLNSDFVVYILSLYIYTYHNEIHPSIDHIVNCEWGDWIIGDCSQTCGEGTRINTREPKIVAEHGGVECIGPSSIAESCQLQTCAGTNTWLSAMLIPLIIYLKTNLKSSAANTFLLQVTVLNWEKRARKCAM